jgi:hypothetical protein
MRTNFGNGDNTVLLQQVVDDSLSLTRDHQCARYTRFDRF